MSTDDPNNPSNWHWIVVSFIVNALALYLPHLWLVFKHPGDAAWWPLAPGVGAALSVERAWPGSPVIALYVAAGFISAMILLVGVAISSVNRAMLALSTVLMLSYASLHLWWLANQP